MRVLCIHHEAPVNGGIYDTVIPEAGHEIVRWLPFTGEAAPELDPMDALVVYGGAVHPDADGTDPWLGGEVDVIRRALDRDLPVLGLCLGAQLIARAAGAWVGPARESEVGWYDVEPNRDGLADPVVGALGGPASAFEWHHYTFELPAGAVELARSERARQAFRLGDRTWGLQFHPEVSRDQVHEWTEWGRDQIEGDPEAMLAQTAERIAAWNATGAEVCRAFLREAAQTR